MSVSTTSKRLKELMEERHLKQVDILEMVRPFCKKYNIKLTKTDLSQYVSGKVEPGQFKLVALASALDVSEHWLMGLDVPREKNRVIIKSHSDFDDERLYALSVLAKDCGYHFDFFCGQYQITFDDCIVKLSPNEVRDFLETSIEQIDVVTSSIINNKLRPNIVSIRTDTLLSAAHERDGIEVTEEMRKHDDDIMDDEDF